MSIDHSIPLHRNTFGIDRALGLLFDWRRVRTSALSDEIAGCRSHVDGCGHSVTSVASGRGRVSIRPVQELLEDLPTGGMAEFIHRLRFYLADPFPGHAIELPICSRVHGSSSISPKRLMITPGFALAQRVQYQFQ